MNLKAHNQEIFDTLVVLWYFCLSDLTVAIVDLSKDKIQIQMNF